MYLELFYFTILYFLFVGGSTEARVLSFRVPNHKHLMCGFFSEGCCDHLVHVGDRGWLTTGPIYELMLLYQTFILFLCLFLCFCVFGFHIWCSPLCIHNMANINNTRGYDGRPANFISWNVKSLNHPVKFKKVFSHLKQLSADIAFLQETHIHSCDSSRLVRGWAGLVY